MASYLASRAAATPSRLGRYELLGHLATGGMAEIHLARLAGEGGFEKIVVVKRLLPELVASPTYVEMFLAEGKLVARLDHANICEVYELGREGAEYYLAMPYLAGVPVHDLIARPRDPDRSAQLRVAAAVVVQACEGLHHAHELRDADGAPAHLVHRDVSPSNLFVTAGGVVKVLDFGIAKVRGAAATEVGMIKGKQQYMAPEQILGEPVDRRCDVFALGIVLFELATHQRLFKRASDYLAARAILEEPIPRADASDPAVPTALADVIERALAREPVKRFATARELGAAVAAAIAPAPAAEVAAMVTASDELSAQRTRQARVLGDARSRVSEVVTTPFADPTTITARPRSGRVWVYAALALVALVAIVVIVLNRSDTPDPVLATGGSTATGRSTSDNATKSNSPTGNATTGNTTSGNTTSGNDNKTRGHSPTDNSTTGSATGSSTTNSTTGNATGSSTTNSPTGNATTGSSTTKSTIANSTTNSAAGASTAASTTGTSTASNSTTGNSTTGNSTTGNSTTGSSATGNSTSGSARGSATAHSTTGNTTTGNLTTGLFSIDSTPYATIYVDGVRIGVTPIVKRSLRTGRRALRAVLVDGRSKNMTIEVPPGKAAPPIQLTW